MTLASTLDVLGRMPLFRMFDGPRLRVVAMTGSVLVFLDGERIAERGEEGEAAYVILEGDVDVLLPSEEGERRITTLGPGEIVGELAVLTGNPRATALVARGHLTLLSLERDVVLALLREYPELALEVIRIIAARLEAMNARAV
ncbi:MAG: Crp/Fnr family transcriptional regulator [Pseudomonadota bacterium]